MDLGIWISFSYSHNAKTLPYASCQSWAKTKIAKTANFLIKWERLWISKKFEMFLKTCISAEKGGKFRMSDTFHSSEMFENVKNALF